MKPKLPTWAITTLTVLLTTTVTWGVMHTYITGGLPLSQKEFAGGIVGARIQMKAVLDYYRKSNWDRTKIPVRLLLLTDQARQPKRDPREDVRNSFAFGKFPTTDEVAFMTDFYVQRKLNIVKGREGELEVFGEYLVAFKDGRIDAIPARLLRIKWFQVGDELIGTSVFPGMRDYETAVAPGIYPSPDLISPAPQHLISGLGGGQ